MGCNFSLCTKLPGNNTICCPVPTTPTVVSHTTHMMLNQQPDPEITEPLVVSDHKATYTHLLDPHTGEQRLTVGTQNVQNISWAGWTCTGKNGFWDGTAAGSVPSPFVGDVPKTFCDIPQGKTYQYGEAALRLEKAIVDMTVRRMSEGGLAALGVLEGSPRLADALRAAFRGRPWIEVYLHTAEEEMVTACDDHTRCSRTLQRTLDCDAPDVGLNIPYSVSTAQANPRTPEYHDDAPVIVYNRHELQLMVVVGETAKCVKGNGLAGRQFVAGALFQCKRKWTGEPDPPMFALVPMHVPYGVRAPPPVPLGTIGGQYGIDAMTGAAKRILARLKRVARLNPDEPLPYVMGGDWNCDLRVHAPAVCEAMAPQEPCEYSPPAEGDAAITHWNLNGEGPTVFDGNFTRSVPSKLLFDSVHDEAMDATDGATRRFIVERSLVVKPNP